MSRGVSLRDPTDVTALGLDVSVVEEANDEHEQLAVSLKPCRKRAWVLDSTWGTTAVTISLAVTA